MKLRHAFTLSLFISSSIFAGTSTNTVHTSSGQLISIGDSFTDMNTPIAQSPISMQTYEKKKAKLALLFLIILMKLNKLIYFYDH
ncbi:hypothetical protein [Acinetobacter nematophilus]|uniref:Uncharacterized protein n=1 Tax=Acinetobacter nematophilus TaxID=2994642 RepID=A0A9X3IIE9_9GAMM|nr:hypothetical protein [Acinetobacter nematophilus]MCX5469943.1 hypothetical protein [Acinetobacter nematophilus]